MLISKVAIENILRSAAISCIGYTSPYLFCSPGAPIIGRSTEICYKPKYLPIITDVSEVVYNRTLADIYICTTGFVK